MSASIPRRRFVLAGAVLPPLIRRVLAAETESAPTNNPTSQYRPYRNWAADHKYFINDGEGLMHENHCNARIRDSFLVGNRVVGNRHLGEPGALKNLAEALLRDNVNYAVVSKR